ncbi:MAG: tRNA uridine(34) 5-carboxymethylaminomethyl modification radical SAM/GNAT enzyme Elp3 [Candidatus Pacebacteria bacterium]|jgi:elongator complex protein 3|nr:tRNA uridine(34) 5-carboxymethylaminomethyl modification radical SAM/GNAT enzyme Elp3 [Candidatus Paceibacterota bacterium]MBT3511687.1 tRNA uridine(34) 5-carboxymethylaminomethyl modification radical SAM/GNAT enzyme Elp3 [Candidatus Paceibacterota bacterium]MBT4005346.1 tRNA uridine(34) 5-carboxymethylaminomethyl modification radical SAM/GNAT enzyme Elp3 [Candidatus Paceibacterota bacterium]MBT4358682.1 tRNA uridine(34) 5-carboxymethylaminomethyl modification radical SAM/GNAT enzyme Elp3 [Ca
MTSYHLPSQEQQDKLVSLFKELEGMPVLNKKKLAQVVKRYPKSPGKLFTKYELIAAYRKLAGTNELKKEQSEIIALLRKKPIRTSSGVTPVTVLTKPFPCPGKCIFCPSDIRMPKSYLADEPGAQRAERNYFDPYLQTYNRLQALKEIGHNIDKAELIVLGGTWSYYPESYQIWFIKECFRALNEFGKLDGRDEVLAGYAQMNLDLEKMKAHVLSSDPVENKQKLESKNIDGQNLEKTYNQAVSEVYTAPERLGGFDKYQAAGWNELEELQKINETAAQRCVGLVVETRPDNISEAEVIRIRRLGATKTQLGFQSLNDQVLVKNKRGHDVAATRRAVKLLRLAGFKIHAHWMANLYGSNVEEDKKDYDKLFNDQDFKPDELKIYPCSLLSSAELMQYYQDGRWQPYSYEELLEVLSYTMINTPQYCRLTRVVRDIPSTDIVEGNKKTNFRQIAQQHLDKIGSQVSDIRAREIRNQEFTENEVKLTEVTYQTSIGEEKFLQFVVPQVDSPAKIVAFLRLSLPSDKVNGKAREGALGQKPFIEELEKSAMIREIHVYGQAVKIGNKGQKRPQHLGFGTKLIQRAQEISRKAGYQKLAVISGIGTKEYYRKKGFTDGKLYQFMNLS